MMRYNRSDCESKTGRSVYKYLQTIHGFFLNVGVVFVFSIGVFSIGSPAFVVSNEPSNDPVLNPSNSRADSRTRPVSNHRFSQLVVSRIIDSRIRQWIPDSDDALKQHFLGQESPFDDLVKLGRRSASDYQRLLARLCLVHSDINGFRPDFERLGRQLGEIESSLHQLKADQADLDLLACFLQWSRAKLCEQKYLQIRLTGETNAFQETESQYCPIGNVLQEFQKAIWMASSTGTSNLFSEICIDYARIARNHCEFEADLQVLESAVQKATDDRYKTLIMFEIFRSLIMRGEIATASRWHKAIESSPPVDGLQRLMLVAQAELMLYGGNPQGALDFLEKNRIVEQLDEMTSIEKSAALSVLSVAFCQIQDYESAGNFAKRLLQDQRGNVLGHLVQCMVQFANLPTLEKQRQLPSLLNRIERARIKEPDYCLVVHRMAFEMKKRMAVEVADNHLVLADLTRQKRRFQQSVINRKTQFEKAAHESITQVSRLFRERNGIEKTETRLAELNQTVSWIIFCGIGTVAGFLVFTTIRIRVASAKTRKNLMNQIREREADHEAKISRQIQAHSDAMMNQLAFNQKIAHELERKQQTDALGLLTGGVVHDFNNLLQVIQQSIENLRRVEPDAKRIDPILDCAGNAIDIGKEIIQCLLAFARDQKLTKCQLELKSYFQELKPLLDTLCGSEMEIRFDVPDGGCELTTDKALLTTAIINLCVNARDAMAGKGSIQIICEKKPENRTLEIHVQDQGCGIPENRLESIFEPFYTSKQEGTSTGLGLSSVREFMERSGGTVEIASQVGKGTTVTLCFPLGSTELVTAGHFQRNDADFRGYSVLLVDDNPMIRKSMTQTMERLGFDVFSADCVEEARKSFELGIPIDLLITDIQFAGDESGNELAKWIEQHFPQTAVITISGQGKTDFASDCEFLAKPFSVAQLIDSLNRVLRPLEKA